MRALIARNPSQKIAIFNHTGKHAHKGGQSIAQTRESTRRRRLIRESCTVTANIKLRHHRSDGLRAQASCWESIFTTLYVVRVVRGGLPKLQWTVITPLQRLCFNPRLKQQLKRTRALRAAGYRVVEKRECDKQRQQDVPPKQLTQTYSYVSSMILTRNTAKFRETKSASHSFQLRPLCYFADLLADTTANVQVVKRACTEIFVKKNGFRFFEIMNYLSLRVNKL